MRLHRISDEKWHLLAAMRRARDLDSAPGRSEIGAIEIELSALHRADDPIRVSPARESVAR
jgi:hypothetical protein